MPDGDNIMAQYFYMAQLQAVKGTCKCKVCELLRKGADQMADAMLKVPGDGTPDITGQIKQLESLGYQVTAPEQGEEVR